MKSVGLAYKLFNPEDSVHGAGDQVSDLGVSRQWPSGITQLVWRKKSVGLGYQAGLGIKSEHFKNQVIDSGVSLSLEDLSSGPVGPNNSIWRSQYVWGTNKLGLTGGYSLSRASQSIRLSAYRPIRAEPFCWSGIKSKISTYIIGYLKILFLACQKII